MSRSQEPSYYEIALTNRQVFVAFAVLLGCLVVAFLSGAWVARDWRGAESPSMAALGPVSGDPSEEALGELDFFSESEAEPPTSRRQVRKPSPQVSPVIEDERSRREPDVKQDTTSQPVPTQGTSPPAVRSQQASDPAPRSSTLVEDLGGRAPEPAAEETRPALPDVARTLPIEAGADDLVIQVFTSADQVKADEVVSSLKRAGHSAYLAPFDNDGRTLYRVRIGPFLDRDRAETVASQVEKSHKFKTWITSGR